MWPITRKCSISEFKIVSKHLLNKRYVCIFNMSMLPPTTEFRFPWEVNSVNEGESVRTFGRWGMTSSHISDLSIKYNHKSWHGEFQTMSKVHLANSSSFFIYLKLKTTNLFHLSFEFKGVLNVGVFVNSMCSCVWLLFYQKFSSTKIRILIKLSGSSRLQVTVLNKDRAYTFLDYSKKKNLGN